MNYPAPYIPPPEEITAATDEIQAKRLADFDEAENRRSAKVRKFHGEDAEALRLKSVEEMEAARLARIAASFAEPGPDDYSPKVRVPVPEGGPVEMTKADICNVESVDDAEMQDALLDVLHAQMGTMSVNDYIGRWTLGKFTPEELGFELDNAPADPPALVLKPKHRPVPFRSAKRGTSK